MVRVKPLLLETSRVHHVGMVSLPRLKIGAGAETRTRTGFPLEDFKTKRKGRRINVLLIRCPFPFPRSTRSALQSEGYGHPRGHLGRRARPVQARHSSIELSWKPRAVQFAIRPSAALFLIVTAGRRALYLRHRRSRQPLVQRVSRVASVSSCEVVAGPLDLKVC